MSKNKIIFLLNHTTTLILKLPCPIEEVVCCTSGDIVFCTSDMEYSIPIYDVQDHMETFSDLLHDALANNLTLHESMLNQDIGFLWNEAYRGKPGFVYEGKEGRVPLWVGDQFRIWCSSEGNKYHFSVWIYNDNAGDIIFEITPDYPWLEQEDEPVKDKDYIPYEEWIKTYKPYVIKKIPRDVAKRWIKQADAIVKKIDENIARAREEDKAE